MSKLVMILCMVNEANKSKVVCYLVKNTNCSIQIILWQTEGGEEWGRTWIHTQKPLRNKAMEMSQVVWLMVDLIKSSSQTANYT